MDYLLDTVQSRLNEDSDSLGEVKSGSSKSNYSLVDNEYGKVLNLIGKNKVSTKLDKNDNVCTDNMKIRFPPQHTSKLHGNSLDYKFDCKVCGETFTRVGHFEKHMRTNHVGAKAFFCEYCKNGFSRRDDCQRHVMNVHLGMRPYKCKECGKGFSKRSVLKRHSISAHGVSLLNDPE